MLPWTDDITQQLGLAYSSQKSHVATKKLVPQPCWLVKNHSQAKK